MIISREQAGVEINEPIRSPESHPPQGWIAVGQAPFINRHFIPFAPTFASVVHVARPNAAASISSLVASRTPQLQSYDSPLAWQAKLGALKHKLVITVIPVITSHNLVGARVRGLVSKMLVPQSTQGPSAKDRCRPLTIGGHPPWLELTPRAHATTATCSAPGTGYHS